MTTAHSSNKSFYSFYCALPWKADNIREAFKLILVPKKFTVYEKKKVARLLTFICICICICTCIWICICPAFISVFVSISICLKKLNVDTKAMTGGLPARCSRLLTFNSKQIQLKKKTDLTRKKQIQLETAKFNFFLSSPSLTLACSNWTAWICLKIPKLDVTVSSHLTLYCGDS